MSYRPGAVPRSMADLLGFLDRELNRIATAYGAMLTTARVRLANGPMIMSGTGTPEGFVVAPQGSVFLRTDGGATTTLYVKTSGTGNTGWTAK